MEELKFEHITMKTNSIKNQEKSSVFCDFVWMSDISLAYMHYNASVCSQKLITLTFKLFFYIQNILFKWKYHCEY